LIKAGCREKKKKKNERRRRSDDDQRARQEVELYDLNSAGMGEGMIWVVWAIAGS
jgi:hypothetical protein